MSLSTPPSGLPFDDIRNLFAGLPMMDMEALAAAKSRSAELAIMGGKAGRLIGLAEWMAAWRGEPQPQITRPLIAIFAANHGIVARGITDLPMSATQKMVETFAAGGAVVNQIAVSAEAGLKVFDLALDYPTPDICEEEALSEAACAATMAFGMEAIAGGTDLLCIGAAGVGSDVVAAALACALVGGKASDWIEGEARIAAVEKAIARHAKTKAEPLEMLRSLGGREFAAIAGAILAARYQRIPVVLDGMVACAAAAILQALRNDALDHCVAAHSNGTAAHDRLLAHIGKRPLMALDITLDEGAGAALAISLLRASLATHAGLATKDQLGPSDLT